MDTRDAYILLNKMDKVGPVVVRALTEQLGGIEAIFDADAARLCEARGVGPELAKHILAQRDVLDAGAECAAAEAAGARVVTPPDEEYPDALKQIHDPPLALYVQGRLDARDRRAIAVIGTRHPSAYGREIAEGLGYGLAKAGYTVISGLAEGIDAAAHRGALRAGGRTLGVLGGALDCFYPPSNAGLAREMAGRGAVLSEFPMGRRPDRTTFPIRNRVVSGMSMGVVVVEASRTSGAMITTRQAMEQGRQVFAVPGRVDSPRSDGCHDLIRNGVTLVRNVDDILEEFAFLIPRDAQKAVTGRAPADLTPTEQALVTALDAGEQPVDALIRASGLEPAAVSATLLSLEMKRVVRMLPGRTVALVRNGCVQGG